MGKYLNIINGEPLGTSFYEKCSVIESHGGESISDPDKWQEGLVCVVDNGFFAAAGYAYDKDEMKAFNYPDSRPKQWYILEDAKEFV